MCYSPASYRYFLVEMRDEQCNQCNKAVMRGQSFTAKQEFDEYKQAYPNTVNVLEIGYEAFVRIEEANK